MKVLCMFSFFLIVLTSLSAQQDSTQNSGAGQFSLGVRSSISMVYEHQWNRLAFGSGGQFRLRFSDKVNSDWFIDFLTGNLSDFAHRTDVHIGWSMLYYPLTRKNPFIQPYILAGHCFELLEIKENGNPQNSVSRRSASVQAGIGTHFRLTPRMDLSFVGQYMIHFGTNIRVSKYPELTFTKPGGIRIQDHLLFHVSVNYQIADLW